VALGGYLFVDLNRAGPFYVAEPLRLQLHALFCSKKAPCKPGFPGAAAFSIDRISSGVPTAPSIQCSQRDLGSETTLWFATFQQNKTMGIQMPCCN